MPAATAQPPAAPAPAAQTPPAPTNPESKQVINVIPQPIEPVPPPKAGSAKAKMFEDLRKRAVKEEPPASETAPAGDPAKKTNDPSGTSHDPSSKPDAKNEPGQVQQPTDKQPPGSPPSKPDKTEKPNPWKLVDKYKAENADLQKQLTEKIAIPEQERKQYLERIEKTEARNKELEDRIRFVDYRKSKEFDEQYQKPYQTAWDLAMGELKEIPVIEEGGVARPMAPADLLNLVNLPLPEARALAKQQFGEFADDVMAHRKTIRQLWDKQAAALAEAEKSGAEREKQQTELRDKQNKDLREAIDRDWNSANEAAVKDPTHGKYFTPTDGDEEGNQRLQRGFALVDKAFKESPLDPSLTPEQRAAVIKRHAAVRNRAAAYSRLVYNLTQKDARIAELEAKLKGYEESAPPADGRQPENSPAPGGTAMEQIKQELRKRAV